MGYKSDLFAKLWANDTGDDDVFTPVKPQYLRMLSSTPDVRALQWKGKVGIDDTSLASFKIDTTMVDAKAYSPKNDATRPSQE